MRCEVLSRSRRGEMWRAESCLFCLGLGERPRLSNSLDPLRCLDLLSLRISEVLRSLDLFLAGTGERGLRFLSVLDDVVEPRSARDRLRDEPLLDFL